MHATTIKSNQSLSIVYFEDTIKVLEAREQTVATARGPEERVRHAILQFGYNNLMQ